MYFLFPIVLTMLMRMWPIIEKEDPVSWTEVFERMRTELWWNQLIAEFMTIHSLLHKTIFALFTMIWMQPITLIVDGAAYLATILIWY